MDAAWVTAGVAVLAMLVTLISNTMGREKREGAIDEKLISHDNRLKAHGLELDGVKERLSFHGERIAKLETWREEHD